MSFVHEYCWVDHPGRQPSLLPYEGFCSWLVHPMGGVRVCPYRHEGVRVKEETLENLYYAYTSAKQSRISFVYEHCCIGHRALQPSLFSNKVFFSRLLHPRGGVRDGPCMHEGIRVKGETLKDIRTAHPGQPCTKRPWAYLLM